MRLQCLCAVEDGVQRLQSDRSIYFAKVISTVFASSTTEEQIFLFMKMMLTTFFELFMSGKSRMCFCGVWPCSHYHFNVLPFPLLTWQPKKRQNRKIRRQKIENVNSRDISSIPLERNRLLFALLILLIADAEKGTWGLT